MHSGADLQALGAYQTDFHLLDGDAGASRGGGGEPFDWSLVAAHRGEAPVIVAGGLTPDNVGEAIAATHPYAVDVASGVEAEPGRKDPALVEAFIAAARPDAAGAGEQAA